MFGRAIGGGEKRKEDAGKKGREDDGSADVWGRLTGGASSAAGGRNDGC